MTICTYMRMVTPWDLQIDTYYDALNIDGQNGYPANASAVSSVTDMGKRGNTQTQATGGSQPAYTRNANNGFPAISFSGSKWMSAAAGAGNSYQGAMTILGVWQNNATGTQRILMKLLSWAYAALSADYNFNIWVSGSGVTSQTSSNPISSGVYQECTMNYNRGTNVTYYKNETSLLTQSFTNLNDAGVGNLYLGSRDGTQQFMTGAVQLIMLFFRQISDWELSYMHLWTFVRGNL